MPYCHRDSPHLMSDESMDSNISTVITKLIVMTPIPKHPTIAPIVDDDPLPFTKNPRADIIKQNSEIISKTPAVNMYVGKSSLHVHFTC